MADLDDARVVLGDPGRRLERAPGSRLHFAAYLGADLVSVAIEADEWVVSTFDAAPRTARMSGAASHSSLRRAVSGATLHLAHTDGRSPVVLDEFVLEERGFRVRRPKVDEPDESDDLGREVVGLTSDPRGPALLYRRSTPEDGRGGVVLATEAGFGEVEALHDLGLLDSLTRTGDTITLVGSFEFDRPIAFEFDPHGVVRRLERIEPGAAPGFVVLRARASLEIDQGAILVRTRDVAGTVDTERRFPRPSGTTAPTIVRDRHGFAIAWTERSGEGWGVRLAHLGIPSP